MSILHLDDIQESWLSTSLAGNESGQRGNAVQFSALPKNINTSGSTVAYDFKDNIDVHSSFNIDPIPHEAIPPKRSSHLSLGGIHTPRMVSSQHAPHSRLMAESDSNLFNTAENSNKSKVYQFNSSMYSPRIQQFFTNESELNSTSKINQQLSARNSLLKKNENDTLDNITSSSFLWKDTHTSEIDSESYTNSLWEVHQSKVSESVCDIYKVKKMLDLCMKQDEVSLAIDDYVRGVPIGNYIPVSKIFFCSKYMPLDYSSDSYENSFYIPNSLIKILNELIKKKNESASGLSSSSSSFNDLLCGTIDNLDIFWYAYDRTLYLWKWRATNTQQLELQFSAPINAIGTVDPKYFLSNTSDASKGDKNSTSITTKLILVATASQLSLWYLKLPNSINSTIEIIASPYVCSISNIIITKIVGHDPSGRLFFGDTSGNLYEFVYNSPESIQNTWSNMFRRLSPWKSSLESYMTTIDKIFSPSMLSKVLRPWKVDAYSIVSISCDNNRGLLYAVDKSSNIHLFFLQPPNITDKKIVDYPLRLLVTLTYTEILSQMKYIFHQVLRAAHENTTSSLSTANLTAKEKHAQSLIEKSKIVKVVPLSKNEGDYVVAIAFTNDSSRLYLKIRLELPLLPHKLDYVYNSEIVNYQYIKSLDVINWKPSAPIFLEHTHDNQIVGTKTDEQTHYMNYYNQRTFLCVNNSFCSTDPLKKDSLVTCVTLDDSCVYHKQRLGVETNDSGSKFKNLREWYQSVPIKGVVLAVYEQNLSPAYSYMLDGNGPLPGPYDVVGRVFAHRLACVKKEENENLIFNNNPQKKNSNIPTERDSNTHVSRISMSPWDIRWNGDFGTNSNFLSNSSKNNQIKYISPVSLHSLSSTQTVPSRLFIIITSCGIYQLQQCRFYDIIKQQLQMTSQMILRNKEELNNSNLLNRQNDSSNISSQLQAIATKPLTSKEIYLAPTILLDKNSTTVSNSNSNSNFNSSQTLNEFKISPLNVYAMSYLFTSEQYLAAIWHILTFTLSNTSLFKTPSQMKSDNQSKYRTSDTKLVSSSQVTRNSLSSAIRTPFSSQSNDEDTTYLRKKEHHISLDNSHQTTNNMLFDFLFSILIHPSLHEESCFQDCNFITSHLYHESSYSPFIPSPQYPFQDTVNPIMNVVSSRFKGLLLYLSRILRPFWYFPVFEAVVLLGKQEDIIKSIPVLYRGVRTIKSYRMAKTKMDANSLKDTNNLTQKKESQVFNDNPAKKRCFNVSKPTDNLDTQGLYSKRLCANPQSNYSIASSSFPLPSGLFSSYINILSSRFNMDEFLKCKQWLDQLKVIIQETIKILESRFEGNKKTSQNTTKWNSKSFLLDYSSYTQTNDSTNSHIFQELRLLKCIELICTVVSEYLQCFSIMLEISESKDIPEDIFDVLINTSLCDLYVQYIDAIGIINNSLKFIGSSMISTLYLLLRQMFSLLFYFTVHSMIMSRKHRNAFESLLTRQILCPTVLFDKFHWIFNRKDFEFQCSLVNLKALHTNYFRMNSLANSYFKIISVEDSVAFRSTDVKNGIIRLLTAAADPHRAVTIEVDCFCLLFSDLQMFDVLAEFIARLVEAFIIEKNERLHASLLSQSDQYMNSMDSYESYMTNSIFKKCRDLYFQIIENYLSMYKELYESSYIYSLYHVYMLDYADNKILGKDVAHNFVKACLNIHIPVEFKHKSSKHMATLYQNNPTYKSRLWLNFVILDWIHTNGECQFPVALEEAVSPFFIQWVYAHKYDLSVNTSSVLSQFFLANHRYYEYSEFLVNIASKKWKDPADLINQSILNLPNCDEVGFQFENNTKLVVINRLSIEYYESILKDYITDDSHSQKTYFQNPAQQNESLYNLKSLSLHWDKILNYLEMTKGGLSLNERYEFYIKARDAIECTLQKKKKNNDIMQCNNTLSLTQLNSNTTNSCQFEDEELCKSLNTLTETIRIIDLQLSLCRETIEITVMLCLKYPDLNLFEAFSSKHKTRQTFCEKLNDENPTLYNHLHNIQSLFYMLQWRIYDTPIQLLRLIEEFSDASKSLIPYPSLALLTNTSLMNYFINNSESVIRSSLIASMIFCRGSLSIELGEPILLYDFVSKFLIMILSRRVEETSDVNKLNQSVVGDYSLTTPSQNLHNQTSSIQVEKFMCDYLSDVLIILHEAALEFCNRPKLGKQPTFHVYFSFDWKIHWWWWPSLLVLRELSVIDDFLSIDKINHLDGEQKLPILQSLFSTYKIMLECSSDKSVHKDKALNDINHLDLKYHHFMCIILYILNTWISQLISISTSLSYIHLLLPEVNSNEVVVSDTNIKMDTKYVDDSQRLYQSLTAHLTDIYQKSPIRIQSLIQQCTNYLKKSEETHQIVYEWYTSQEELLDSIENTVISNGSTLSNMQDIDFCTREIKFSAKEFLNKLNTLQLRIVLVDKYQKILKEISACYSNQHSYIQKVSSPRQWSSSNKNQTNLKSLNYY